MELAAILGVRGLLFQSSTLVLRKLVQGLASASPAQLISASKLLENTCSVISSGLSQYAALIFSTREDGSSICPASDDGPGIASAAAKSLLHCLCDVYELVVPVLAALLAVHECSGEEARLQIVCRDCLDSAFIITDLLALQPIQQGGGTDKSTSTAAASGISFLVDLVQYNAGFILPVDAADFPVLGVSSLHARGSFSVDICRHYRIIELLLAASQDASRPASSELSRNVDFVRAVLAQRQRNLDADSTLPAPVALAHGASSPVDEGSIVAVMDILPTTHRTDIVHALQTVGGDVAAAVERLLQVVSESDGAADAVSMALPGLMPRRGDAVPALDPALKAATLRRAADIAVADVVAATASSAAAGAVPLQCVPPIKGSGTSASSSVPHATSSVDAAQAAAAAALMDRGAAMLYEDEWDDAYDDVEHMDIPDAGSSDDGEDGEGAEGVMARPPSSFARGSGRRGYAGSDAGRQADSRRGSTRGVASQPSSVAPAPAAVGSEPHGNATGGVDAASHGPTGRGRGRGRGVVTGHGPRAKGGLTEHEAARRRELKARVGNHNRKRGADRKMAGSFRPPPGGFGAPAAPPTG